MAIVILRRIALGLVVASTIAGGGRAGAAYLTGEIGMSGASSAEDPNTGGVSILHATNFGLGPTLTLGGLTGDFHDKFDAVSFITRLYTSPAHLFTIEFAQGGFNGFPQGTFTAMDKPFFDRALAGSGTTPDRRFLEYSGLFTPTAHNSLSGFSPTPMIFSIGFSQVHGTTPINFTATFISNGAQVPEPSSLVLAGIGAVGLMGTTAARRAGLGRRRTAGRV